MGAWRDFWFGPEPAASQSSIALEKRSGDPELPTPDVNTALIIPKRDAAADKVAEGDALGLIAVYRGVSILSTSVMQLSLDAYRQDSQIEPRPAILAQPDIDESLASFLEKTTLCLALNGNFFWRIFRDNQGRVTGLRVLNPHDVVIQTDTEGNVTGYKYSRRETPFTKKEIYHGSLMRVPGDPRGRGPIQAAQAELRGALDTSDYSSHWFTESGVPTGLLTSKTPLNAQQAEEAKQRWTDTQGGYRGVAVLGGDWNYQQVYLSPEDAQFIQVRQFNKTDIATLFGIPAHLMLAAVDGSSMTYSNISQAWVEFSKFTLSRYVIEIESAFSAVMPRGTEVKFNLEALLRPDVVTRYQMHTQALQAGFMSINEVRDIEKLTPAPDGDFKSHEQKVKEQQELMPPAADSNPDEEESSE